jgi:hypothetical protein
MADAGFRFVPGHAPEDLAKDLLEVEARFESRAIRTADSLAGRIESWMKAGATWQDRTGDARRGLYAEASRSGALGQGKTITIEFGYGPKDDPIPYAIYLVTMQAGRFDIVGPAINHWGPIMIAEIYEGR